MSCPECPHCKDSYPEAFKQAIAENIAGISEAASFVMLHNEALKDFADEPWPTIQLAIAIVADKPIVLGILEGSPEPSGKLLAIADSIIRGSPETVVKGVAEWHQGRCNHKLGKAGSCMRERNHTGSHSSSGRG